MWIRKIHCTVTMVGLFCMGESYAQSDVLLYHSLIYSAENSILNSNFYEARNLYRRAFDLDQEPFFEDLLNAAIVSNILGDSIEAKKCIQISDSLHCINLYDSDIDSVYGSLVRDLDPERSCELDYEYRDSIFLLFKVDQQIRTSHPDYSLWTDSLFSIDHNIRLRLMNLILNRGFPSQQRVGIFFPLTFPPPYYYVILHAYQSSDFRFDEVLEEALNLGEIKPEMFASLTNHKVALKGPGYGMNTVKEYKDDLYVFYHPDAINAMNEERASIMLDEMNVAQRKVVFRHTSNPHRFVLARYNYLVHTANEPRPDSFKKILDHKD